LEAILSFAQGSIYWNKYCLMGKKYHENNARPDTNGEKERKDKGRKEKISASSFSMPQCFGFVW
jgi:hypothetical protein